MDRSERRWRTREKHIRRLREDANRWVLQPVYEEGNLEFIRLGNGRPFWTAEDQRRKIGRLRDNHYGCGCGACKLWKHQKRLGKGKFNGSWIKVSELRRLLPDE